MDSLIAGLQAIVGARHCLIEPDTQAPFVADWRGIYHGRARAVVLPGTVAEVQAIVRLARQHHAPIVPQGGNTGLSGGATPDDSGRAILLSLKRLTKVRTIDPLNNSMIAEAGCILANLQQAANEADRLFPLSLSAEGTCQIGGNLATNAGGINVLRYGNARDLCLGLEIVLPDGTLLSNLHGLRKDNTGYDLKQIFIGSEGTLGIITAAALKLFPKPVARATSVVALSDLDVAPALLARCRAGLADQLVSFELLPRFGIELGQRFMPGLAWPLERLADWSILIEANTSSAAFDIRAAMEQCLADALDAGEIIDAAVASSEAQSLVLWQLREGIVEGQNRTGASIKHDVSVPVAQVPAFVKAGFEAVLAAWPEARLLAFGHLGDGNIHFNLTQPEGESKAQFLARTEGMNRIVHDLVARFAGSISAEHGIGQLRRAELQHRKPAAELDLMRRIKRMLDPDDLMNPGKLV
ncbi:FAD-binding oxidoreductase [Dongia deserti]|uniref:FAD-binding oxidoreductase n=1 Tax=Dongia deserti TaxID=2268030 RepID=UPI000E6467FA|nr:FAD-binding oxidoreductase [Dongia deserti]